VKILLAWESRDYLMCLTEHILYTSATIYFLLNSMLTVALVVLFKFNNLIPVILLDVIVKFTTKVWWAFKRA